MLKLLILVIGLFLCAMHVNNFYLSVVNVKRDPQFLDRNHVPRFFLVYWRTHNLVIAASALLGAILVWTHPTLGVALVLAPIGVYVLMGIGLVALGRHRGVLESIRKRRK